LAPSQGLPLEAALRALGERIWALSHGHNSAYMAFSSAAHACPSHEAERRDCCLKALTAHLGRVASAGPSGSEVAG